MSKKNKEKKIEESKIRKFRPKNNRKTSRPYSVLDPYTRHLTKAILRTTRKEVKPKYKEHGHMNEIEDRMVLPKEWR